MIEVYVASHFRRFAFEVVSRRSGYLTSHDLRARSRAGSHAIGPYVFSNALGALQQALSTVGSRIGELRRLAGMQVDTRVVHIIYVCI